MKWVGYNVIGCKWVCKNKHNVDGTFQCHKTRVGSKRLSSNPWYGLH